MNRKSDGNVFFDGSDLTITQPAISGELSVELEQPAISDDLTKELIHLLIPPENNSNPETSR